MRYRINSWPMMDGHLITISGYSEADPLSPIPLMTFTVPYSDLKVDDLLHLLESIWREVGAVTP